MRGGLPQRPIQRLAVLCLALAAAAAVQSGMIDALRTGPVLAAWQVDELLFLALVTVLGIVLVDRANTREVHREMVLRTAQERHARDLALRDSLTGLLNRRGMEEAARRHSADQPTRLIFLADFDGFKRVNDTHGHAVGDEVLRRFAARLAGLTDAGLTVDAARLGGDEFVVIASGTAAHADEALGTRIAAVLDCPAGDGGPPLLVSVSVGMARWTPGLNLENALENADLAMYEAKRIGAGLCRYDRLRDAPSARIVPADRVFERKLATLPNQDAAMCVAAIALDRYATAKRTLGYGFAGQLLRAVRERLEAHRPALLIERLGPDTLGLLFPADDVEQALAVTDAINALSSESYLLDGVTVDSPLTIGMAGPAPASALRDTVEQAQWALDEARRAGRRQVVFDLREQHRAAQNLRLMNELQDAIAGDRLQLHYQPKMSARTGEIDSLEALVRWPQAAQGMISPGIFIPIAEQSGDIKALTWWVLDRALADSARLAVAGMARPIYINVSAQLVGDPEFAERLLATLEGQQGRIGIEITETAVLDNPERALAHLVRIADAGIKIAIDDYGVGLSSLSYLKRLPATELKIDMMFITDLAESHSDPMIVRSTIDLAHGLGLRVTAEGVDKPESLALLRIMGCDMIQGHQIAAAMSYDDLTAFLRDYRVGAVTVPDCAAQLLAFVK